LFLRYSGDEELGVTPFGSVLRRTHTRAKARIYVNGLRVAEEDNFLFSYNITSPTAALRRALNRERSDVGRSAYNDRVKAILLACDQDEVIDTLVADLQKYERGTTRPSGSTSAWRMGRICPPRPGRAGHFSIRERPQGSGQACRRRNDLPELGTERIILAAARVGQHVFALNVLNNCGRRCVFCGLNPSAFGARRMLLAGHIKPWKDSAPAERLDPQNGLAACPSHDVALDTALLTVSAELKTHIAPSLADAVRGDDLTRQYYGRPPLLETLLLPDNARLPGRKYLDWHREKIFVA
jgi:hypothetical protein